MYHARSLLDRLFPLGVTAPTLVRNSVAQAEHRKCAPVSVVEKLNPRWDWLIRNLLAKMMPTEEHMFSVHAKMLNVIPEEGFIAQTI